MVSYEEYKSIQRINTEVYFDEKKLFERIAQDRSKLEGLKKNILSYMNMGIAEENCMYFQMNKEEILNYLINVEEVSPDYFVTRDNYGKVTTNSLTQEIKERLTDKGYAPEFFQMYNYYSSIVYSFNSINSFYNGLREVDVKDRNGNKLSTVPFCYNVASTNRLYTSNQSVQALPKLYTDHVTCPDGYFILWADFKQIDLRVAMNLVMSGYLKSSEINFEDTDDYYKMLTQIWCHKLDIEFNEEYYQSMRGPFKAGILSSIYGSSVHTITGRVKDSRFASQVHSFINSEDNPDYTSYKSLVKRNLSYGQLFNCYSYFGTIMRVHPKDKDAYTAALNRPMQGTSADLMAYVVVNACKNIWRHTNNKNTFLPYFNRHDENLFLCHKSSIPYIYEFLKLCELYVDDWKPISLSWSAGYNYGNTDEDLVKEILNASVGKVEKTVIKTKHSRPFRGFTVPDEGVNVVKKYNGIHFQLVSSMKGKTIIYVDRPPNMFELIDDIRTKLTYPDDVDRIIFYSEEDNWFEKEGVEYIFDNTDYQSKTYFYEVILNHVIYRYFKKKTGVELEEFFNQSGENFLAKENIEWII